MVKRLGSYLEMYQAAHVRGGVAVRGVLVADDAVVEEDVQVHLAVRACARRRRRVLSLACAAFLVFPCGRASFVSFRRAVG